VGVLGRPVGGAAVLVPGPGPVGGVVQHDGLVFKVERVEKRRVMRVKLEILQTNGEGEEKDELDRARSGA